MSQDMLFLPKSYQKWLEWEPKLGRVGSQGITNVSRLGRARAQQMTMAYVSTSVWREAAPPALALKLDNSVPSHMSLTPFELLH